MKNKTSEILIFSRTSWCNRCNERGSPSKGDLCAIWHTKSHQFIIHKVTGRTGSRGFTPAIFITDIPTPKGDTVSFTRSCGICDCIINAPDEDDETNDGKYSMEIAGSELVTIPRKDWIALWKNWKGTGYEIE